MVQPLLKGSAVVFIATLVGNFLSYLYHLLVGRRLSPEDYGLLESFIALTYFFGVPIQAFTLSIVKTINETNDKNLKAVVKNLENKAFFLSLAAWGVLLVLFPLFKRLLQFENNYLFLFFSLQALFIFTPVVYGATLQAKLRFVEMSLIGIVASIAKIVVALIFVILGYEVFGALTGYLATGIVSLLAGWFFVRQKLPQSIEGDNKSNLPNHFWQFSTLSLGVNLALISLYSTDILLARYFLSPDESGFYSATSIVGKVIIFVTNAILVVAFPVFVKHKKSLLKLKQMYFLSLLLMGGMVTVGIGAFHFFPEFIVSLLYRNQYNKAIRFVPLFSIFIGLLALLNLLTQFLLALEKRVSLWLAGFAAVLQIALILGNHATIEAIISSSIISVIAALTLGSAYVYTLFYAKKK